MNNIDNIKKEAEALYEKGAKFAKNFKKGNEGSFRYDYQRWYSCALRVVEFLAPDRYQEFRSYYEINPKRNNCGYGNYVIQDYIKGIAPSRLHYPDFDSEKQTLINFFNQLTIFESLVHRIESSLGNIEEEIFSELKDIELETARKLTKVSVRAGGVLAGVVIETYLQKLAKRHSINVSKKNPTIGDLNDPLKNAGLFDIPTWRKVSYLADIRNICAHKKDTEPAKEQVEELIEGANWLIKNVF